MQLKSKSAFLTGAAMLLALMSPATAQSANNTLTLGVLTGPGVRAGTTITLELGSGVASGRSVYCVTNIPAARDSRIRNAPMTGGRMACLCPFGFPSAALSLCLFCLFSP